MGNHHNFRVGRNIQVVADIAQAFGGLSFGVVDFLFQDAKDKKNPSVDYGSLVSALKARGVRFEVCEITLKNRNLKTEQFSLDAEFTPSGVVRVGQLQSREKFAYIKP